MISEIHYNPFRQKREALPIIKQSNKGAYTFFISSTFIDMQVERDELMYKILPQIKAFARQYGERIEFYDFRWGIDSRIDRNKSISICIEAALSSNYFIGLLGDRYGWIPDEDLLKKELGVHFTKGLTGKSITALEIEFGSLRDLSKPCLFYFRYPSQTNFVEKDKQLKNEELKKNIHAKRGKDCKSYSFLGGANKKFDDETIISDIKKLLLDSHDWGQQQSEPVDDYQAELNILDAFCNRCSEDFCGREKILDDLLSFATNTMNTTKLSAISREEKQVILINGAYGSGKSALLCKLMKDIPRTCLLLPEIIKAWESLHDCYSGILTPEESEQFFSIVNKLICQLEDNKSVQ